MSFIAVALFTAGSTTIARLLFEPRFDAGVFLILIGVVIKFLSNPIAGISAFFGLFFAGVLFFVLAWNAQFLLNATKFLGSSLSVPARYLIESLTGLPLYFITLIFFALPTVAQIWGSMSLFNLLLKANRASEKAYQMTSDAIQVHNLTHSEGQELILPPIVPTLLIYAVYAGYWAFSKDGKAPTQTTQIVMQSTWVVSSLLSAQGRANIFRSVLTVGIPSLCFGWGSYFLKSIPATSVVQATVFGAVAASIAVGTTAGFGRAKFKKTTAEAVLKQEEQSRMLQTMSDFMRKSVHTLTSVDIPAIREATLETFNNVGVFFSPEMFSPPVQVSVIVSCFKLAPTAISSLAILSNVILSISSTSVVVSGLFCVVLQVPIILKELFNVYAFLNKLGSAKEPQNGMSVLLFDSPKALQMWNIFWNANNEVKATEDGATAATVSTAVFKAVTGHDRGLKDIIFPSDDFIAQTRDFDREILLKLVASVAIDIIGVATFAVPVIGEAVDVLWAPISSYLVQSLYNNSAISTINFLEELLPFMDIIPTATLGFLYTYHEEIPVWVIRFSRDLKIKLKTA